MITARARNPTRRGQPKRCRVCELPASERDLVDQGLLFGWSPQSIAVRFGSINRKDVTYHARNCVSEEKEEE